MSIALLIALTLMGIWTLIVGEVSLGQLLLGLTFGSLFVLATGMGAGRAIPLSQLPGRLGYLALYILVLIPYDIVRSNVDMAWRLLRPRPFIRPGIVRVRLAPVPETLSAVVAHAITMSPGEMIVDYSDDGRIIYVHLIDVTDVEQRAARFWRIYYSVLERVFA